MLVYERLAQVFREKRERNGHTREHVAYKAGVSLSTVYRFESGKPTRLDAIISMFQAIGCQVQIYADDAELLEGN